MMNMSAFQKLSNNYTFYLRHSHTTWSFKHKTIISHACAAAWRRIKTNSTCVVYSYSWYSQRVGFYGTHTQPCSVLGDARAVGDQEGQQPQLDTVYAYWCTEVGTGALCWHWSKIHIVRKGPKPSFSRFK